MKLLRDDVFRQMVLRAIRTDYLENLTGFAWLLLQPLLLLAVYTFVFTNIFKARLSDAGEIAFVPFLAVAFWPWTAFSEAVLRSSTSITSSAALIGKVSFATELLPLSTVFATFMMQMAGYLAVLVMLQLLGTPIHWLGLLLGLPLLALLLVFASALALLVSALQVFVRDVTQILPPLMTFWFFTTPVLYSTSLLPPSLAVVMQFNPMAWYVDRLRNFLLFGDFTLQAADAVVPLATVVLFWLALRFFRRFSPHFEDFL